MGSTLRLLHGCVPAAFPAGVYNQFNNRNQTALDVALEVGASERIMAELRARGARAHNELAP